YRMDYNLEQPIHHNAKKNKSSTQSLEEENHLLLKELASAKKDREILKRQLHTSRKKLYKVRLDKRANYTI
ncbi:hypothetical protein N8972_02290, partial [Sulfurospirillum sp.]|nr:hypothetical protein [Sulfurospirillum sp.]